MKKILLAIVALCVIAAFALPPIIASQTEKMLADSLNNNEAMAQYFNVKVADYKKGYRQSTARLDFGLGPTYRAMIESQVTSGSDDADTQMSAADIQEMRDMLNKVFSMDVEIEHGPLLLSNGVGVGLNHYHATLSDTEMVSEIEQMIGVEDFLEILSHTTLTGTTKITATLKPFEFEEEDTTVTFSGMRNDGSWTQSSKHLLTKGKAANLSITSDDVDMIVENIAFDIDNYILDGGFIATGTSAFSVGSMKIASPDTDGTGDIDVTISGMSFESLVTEPDADDTLDIEAAYKIASVTGFGDAKARNMSFAFAMRNISRDVFTQYQKLMMNADIDEEQMEALQELLYNSLITSPVMEIGPIQGTIDGESFRANVDVKVDGAKLPPAAEFFFADPLVWMTIASADAKINASEKLINMAVDSYIRDQISASLPADTEVPEDELDEMVVQQRPMLTGQVIDQGMVTLENGEYTTTATFVDGELTVNGTPFPLEALMGGGP